MSYITQLRTTDLDRLITFYVEKLGFEVGFRYEDFYAGILIGESMLHLKLIDDPDPGIESVRQGNHFHLRFPVADLDARQQALKQLGLDPTDIMTNPWGREFVLHDPDGHTLYFCDLD